MTQVIWVDSRMRSSGSDSDFEVSMRESVHLSDARVRVDKLTFVDSFLTTDAGQHMYFGTANAGFSYATVPQGAYTGFTLASAIQTATGRETSYSLMTNSISHVLAGASAPWLSDAELAARTGSFPPGASSSDPRSLNAVLGEGTISGSIVTWAFVRMAPWSVLYLRSNRLRCENHHGPRGTHDILCSVPLTGGVGTQVEVSSPIGAYYNLAGGSSCRTIDFRLTDWLGRAVNLRGRSLAFQLIFDFSSRKVGEYSTQILRVLKKGSRCRRRRSRRPERSPFSREEGEERERRRTDGAAASCRVAARASSGIHFLFFGLMRLVSLLVTML